MIAERAPDIHYRQQRETSGGIAAGQYGFKAPGLRAAHYVQLVQLSPEELEIISDLRKLSKEGRAAVVDLIGEIVDREDSTRLLEEGLLLSAQSFLRDEQEP
jgi:hypothetical protein